MDWNDMNETVSDKMRNRFVFSISCWKRNCFVCLFVCFGFFFLANMACNEDEDFVLYVSNFDSIGPRFVKEGSIAIIERQNGNFGSDFRGFIDMGEAEYSEVSHSCRERWWDALCLKFNEKQKDWNNQYYRESNLAKIKIDPKYSSLVIPGRAPIIVVKLNGFVCVYESEQIHRSNNKSNKSNKYKAKDVDMKTKEKNNFDEYDSDEFDPSSKAAVFNDFRNSLGFTIEYKAASAASVRKAMKSFSNSKNNNSKSNSNSNSNSRVKPRRLLGNRRDQMKKNYSNSVKTTLTGKKRKFGALMDDMSCSNSIGSSSKSSGKAAREAALWQTVGSYLVSILIVTHGEPIFSISTSMNDLEDGWFVYFSKNTGLTAVKLRMRQMMKIVYEMMTKGNVLNLIHDIDCHPAQGKGQAGLQSWVCFVFLFCLILFVCRIFCFVCFDRC